MRARLILIVVPLALIAFLFATRPNDVRVLTPSASPAAARTAAATTDLSQVPAACRGDVKGAVFASGALEQRINAANDYATTHRGQTESIVVTDDVMRDYASRQQWSVPVQDMSITIDPAGFHLTTTVSVFGRYTIRALLVPSAVNGTLRIATQQLDTDGMPGFFTGSVQDALASATDTSKWNLKSRVDGVVTRSGCAVVWGAAA